MRTLGVCLEHPGCVVVDPGDGTSPQHVESPAHATLVTVDAPQAEFVEAPAVVEPATDPDTVTAPTGSHGRWTHRAVTALLAVYLVAGTVHGHV